MSSEKQVCAQGRESRVLQTTGGRGRVSGPREWAAFTIKCAEGWVNVKDQVDEERQVSRRNLQA